MSKKKQSNIEKMDYEAAFAELEETVQKLEAGSLPLAEALAPRLPAVRRWIVMTDGAHMPETSLSGAISYEDFITYKGEQGAKEAGKLRLEGKDYVVQDGDVIHFRFNV